MVRTDYFAFRDILKVDILPGPVTVYAVRGRGRGMHFTSFFTQHRRLMELLVERAGLSRCGERAGPRRRRAPGG